MDYMNIPLKQLLDTDIDQKPILSVFGTKQINSSLSIRTIVDNLTDEDLMNIGMSREQLLIFISNYIKVETSRGSNPGVVIETLTILGGQSKSGTHEDLEMTLHPGDSVCIVGPTGSGKSRLLEDIEYLAQGDTPTRRRIFINGKPVEDEIRFASGCSLTAQLSQNMNFVMDLCVSDFLMLHAESRKLSDGETIVRKVLKQANDLAGEPFSAETSLTQLSGGQSRALMIADVAFLSSSPVVLIDEIENAGVNRQQALELLARNDKIVLLSTHDPLLALTGDRRLVIRNGAVEKVITPSSKERKTVEDLVHIDRLISSLRDRIRSGEEIDDAPLRPPYFPV